MPNNKIPVSDLRDWCRFKASSKPNKSELVAKLSRHSKNGVQNMLVGLSNTPSRGHIGWDDASNAVKAGVRASRPVRRFAKSAGLDVKELPIDFSKGVLEDLPTAGIPHEVPVERQFEVDGRTFVLRGRMDAESPDGTCWEYKTVKYGKPRLNRINRSYQWRSYLWAKPELTAVNYSIFHVKFRKGSALVAKRQDLPPKWRCERLERDMRDVLEGFVAWVDHHCPTYWD